MKKLLLPALGLLFASISMAQNGRNQLTPATGLALKSKVLPNPNQPKTMTCLDTLRYPQVKEQVLGTNNFYNGFGVWQADNESLSMAFLNGGSLNITGIEFFGANDATNGTTSVTVNAAVYSVNAAYTPTTLLGSGNITITQTTYGYRYVTLATPVTVTGNYAIVLKPTNASGVLNMLVNDQLQGQSYDETFAKFFSAYSGYPNPNNWNTIPVFSPGYNYEPVIAPIVNYSINTNYTPSATTVCQGTPVTYTNATTPMGVLSSRVNNYSVFLNYFGAAAADSTFVYDMDNLSPYIWSGTTTYTHPAAGVYDVLLATNGGFWSSCFDYTIKTITVNATPPTPTITAGGPTTFCAGGSVTLTSSASTGNMWSNGATTQSITVSTAGTYTLTETTGLGCTSAAASQVVTVNALPPTPTITASGPTTFCTGGSVTLTSSPSTAYMWSNGASTQNITVSNGGTIICYAFNASGCQSAASNAISVVVNPLDNATFTYTSNTICQSAPNTTPVINSSGAFSSTPAGLIFANGSTGEINVAASSIGTYSVTFTTSGSCPNTSSQTIVITSSSDASFSYASPAYCSNATNPLPVFGSGASAGTFSSSAGLTINSSTGEITLSSSTAGTYTVTNTIPASGGCLADTKTTSVTINTTPTATVTGGGSICGTGSTTVNVALTGSGPWDITYSDGSATSTVNGVVSSPYTITASTAGTYTVTSVTMAGCSNTGTGSASVTVHANPTVTFTPVSNLCENASAVTLVASPAGGTFTGSTGVSGNTFNPSGLSGSITLTYTYTDGNACSGSATSTFNVNALPTVTLGTFTAVCSDVAPFALTGGLPAGGTYSGTGVSGANFDPSAATIGSNAITYVFTDGNGCSASATQSITVNDCAGIAEVSIYELLVYPNPASQSVVIKAGKDVSYTMVTEDGKIVIPFTNLVSGQEVKVETSQFARGMYYLQFIGENGIAVEKVILR